MNLSILYLKAYITKTYKLHTGTWNGMHCIRAHEWDNDTWAFTKTDIEAHGLNMADVEKRFVQCYIKPNYDGEILIFTSRVQAFSAARVLEQILLEFYMNRKEIS